MHSCRANWSNGNRGAILIKENLFLIPLGMVLRFAVCAVEEAKCRKAPQLIKKAIDEIEG